MTYPNVVFDYSNTVPSVKTPYESYAYFYNLKMNTSKITEEDKHFLEFADRYSLFKINK